MYIPARCTYPPALPLRLSWSVAVDYKAKLLKFTFLLLVSEVAALGSVVFFLIIILTAFVLAFAHWIYLIVLRAWEYMRYKLANLLPVMPAANVYSVPDQPPPYQQQVPMYGVGEAFPFPLAPPPRYQSSVKIQEVCRRLAGKRLSSALGLVFLATFCLKRFYRGAKNKIWSKISCSV